MIASLLFATCNANTAGLAVIGAAFFGGLLGWSAARGRPTDDSEEAEMTPPWLREKIEKLERERDEAVSELRMRIEDEEDRRWRDSLGP